MSHHDEISQNMEEEGGGSIYTAKSFIVDIAANHGLANFNGIKSIDLYFEGTLIDILLSDLAAHDETTRNSAGREAQYAFDTSLSKTGPSDFTTYLSSNITTTDRIWVKFINPKTFDKVVVNNWHEAGTNTGAGSNDVVMTITEDLLDPITTFEAPVTGGVVIYAGTLDEHIAADVADPQTLVLIP